MDEDAKRFLLAEYASLRQEVFTSLSRPKNMSRQQDLTGPITKPLVRCRYRIQRWGLFLGGFLLGFLIALRVFYSDPALTIISPRTSRTAFR